MLIYDNNESLRSLLQVHGSVVYRNIPISLIIGIIALVLAIWKTRYDYILTALLPFIEHPFAGTTAASAVSFALIWRTSLAWSRYWEAADQCYTLYSKWADSFAQLVSFLNSASKKASGDKTKQEELENMKRHLAHLFSVLSAIAMHRLSHGDLSRIRCRSQMWGMKSRGCNICCSLRSVWLHWHELISTREIMRFDDKTGAFKLPRFVSIQLTNQTTGLSKISVPKKAGRQSLWDVEWVILGKLTSEEQAALTEETDGDGGSCSLPDRVNIIFEWLMEEFNDVADISKIPPPIASRCYQELSSGMLAYNRALKMADIPFPFPFSQLVEFLIRIFTCVVPFYVSLFTVGLTMTAFLAFAVTISMWSLSEISRELENPFSESINQIPVHDMHERFVEMLRTVGQSRRPARAKSQTDSREFADQQEQTVNYTI
eukprot:TRINITY_DN3081_c0_g1_i1.p1 TRINITY_DN3081_c0_g1~~TRINITY_DN3081_c0_g1_i1.p1  ORF type:complete len:431 (-),score=48.15 TRINITY_DN3081_c0_g1_i1:246-1538(-)